MFYLSRMMDHPACRASALFFLFGIAAAGEIEIPGDSHGLEEVRSLTKLPVELAKALDAQGDSNDRIADLERISGPIGEPSFDRWFLLAGLSESYALIAIEEHTNTSRHARIHANAFSLTGSGWIGAGEWALSSRPHTVDELIQLLRSPESKALTASWRKLQRDRDLRQRMAESDPARYRPSRLRDVDINDEEVRQIEAVVRELMPGAIVMISGVAKGCPCEDGPGCSAQVWIAVHLPKQTRALELSDINDHWVIGPVQQWFLDSLQIDRSKYPTRADYNTAQDALNDRYPTCSAGP